MGQRANTPRDVTVDTSVIVASLVAGLPNSTASHTFLETLVANDSRVYFSQILRVELAEAFRRLAKRAQIPSHIRQQFLFDQWDQNVLVRQRWMAFSMREFQLLLSRFSEVYELPITTHTWERSIDIIAVEQFRSIDAIHLATARQHGLRHLVTLDDHFTRATDLEVWLLRDQAES